MEPAKETVKYPENLYLSEAVTKSGQTVKHIAKSINRSRKVVSDTIHGHYKGTNIIPLIKAHLNLPV